MKYQVVYQGRKQNSNQIIGNPLDFDTANWLVCTLQAELPDKNSGFYIVEPIIQNSNAEIFS